MILLNMMHNICRQVSKSRVLDVMEEDEELTAGKEDSVPEGKPARDIKLRPRKQVSFHLDHAASAEELSQVSNHNLVSVKHACSAVDACQMNIVQCAYILCHSHTYVAARLKRVQLLQRAGVKFYCKPFGHVEIELTVRQTEKIMSGCLILQLDDMRQVSNVCSVAAESCFQEPTVL